MKGNLCNQSFLFKSAPSAFFSCCILHNVRLTALLKMKGKQTQASLQKYRFYVYIIFESIDETSSDEKKVSSSFLSPSQAKPSWDQCLCWLPAFDGDFVMICWWKNPLKLNEDWTSECDSEWNEEKKFLDHAERRVSMGTSKIPYNFCCSSGKIIKMFFYLLRLFLLAFLLVSWPTRFRYGHPP